MDSGLCGDGARSSLIRHALVTKVHPRLFVRLSLSVTRDVESATPNGPVQRVRQSKCDIINDRMDESESYSSSAYFE